MLSMFQKRIFWSEPGTDRVLFFHIQMKLFVYAIVIQLLTAMFQAYRQYLMLKISSKDAITR